MKKLLLFLCLVCSSAWAECNDPLTGYTATLQPGQSQVFEFDYTDCWYGIQSWWVYVEPTGKGNLPKTLSAECLDITSGAIADHILGEPFVLGFWNQLSVCGHKLQVVVSNSGKKPVSFTVSTTENLGGPCLP